MQVLASNPKFCKEEPKFNIQIRQDKGAHSANGQGNSRPKPLPAFRHYPR